jgi:hypothetical protein
LAADEHGSTNEFLVGASTECLRCRREVGEVDVQQGASPLGLVRADDGLPGHRTAGTGDENVGVVRRVRKFRHHDLLCARATIIPV